MAGTNNVTADAGGSVRLALAGISTNNVTGFGTNISGVSYVYLTSTNLRGEFGFANTSNTTGTTTGYGYAAQQVSNFTSGKSEIYENGKAAIYM